MVPDLARVSNDSGVPASNCSPPSASVYPCCVIKIEDFERLRTQVVHYSELFRLGGAVSLKCQVCLYCEQRRELVGGGGRVFREQAAPPTGLPAWPCFSSCSQCVPNQEFMPPAKPSLWLQRLGLAEGACWSAGWKGPFWEEKRPPRLLRSPWSPATEVKQTGP